MNRRHWIAGAAAVAGGTLLLDQMQSAAAAAGLVALAKSPRMPVLFVGHGTPMNAIEDNEFRRSWQALGAQFGKTLPKPQLILCMSPHWITSGWRLTAMAQPRTIHDFGGFPQELFDQRYPAPGAPEIARQIGAGIREARVGLDDREWGYDHGTWSVLKPMFPAADIPVLQLSIDYGKSPAEHFALGRQLRSLRDRGVLIVGSGNIVHNLRASRRGAATMQAYDWAFDFDGRTKVLLEKGALEELANFQGYGQVAQLAHPTYDHYLPLLQAAGAVDAGEKMRFFNERFQSASMSMRSVVWG
ncbi:MAG: dioxygenase extradiol [Ramlibacter sp.]|nr:dioxygenase extradiol [Ramlibacter sp.]